MILLSKDETAMRAAYSVMQGVAAAASDEPLDPAMFEGGSLTVEEADLAARRSNVQRDMARAVAERRGRH